MDVLSGATPNMDKSSDDLEEQCKSFVQHVAFTFSGPQKRKKKYAYHLKVCAEQKRRKPE